PLSYPSGKTISEFAARSKVSWWNLRLVRDRMTMPLLPARRPSAGAWRAGGRQPPGPAGEDLAWRQCLTGRLFVCVRAAGTLIGHQQVSQVFAPARFDLHVSHIAQQAAWTEQLQPVFLTWRQGCPKTPIAIGLGGEEISIAKVGDKAKSHLGNRFAIRAH